MGMRDLKSASRPGAADPEINPTFAAIVIVLAIVAPFFAGACAMAAAVVQ